MTCNEQSCQYAQDCTDLDKQKMAGKPWECWRYLKSGTPEHFQRCCERGYV